MEKEKIKKICDALDTILNVLELPNPNWDEFPTDIVLISEIIKTMAGSISMPLMAFRFSLQNPEMAKALNVEKEKQSVFGTVQHYAEGAVKAVKAMTLPETEESKARLAVCHGCDKWTGTSCKVCGCFVNLKVKIPEEKCPEGKW